MWLDTFRALNEAEQLLASVLLKDHIPLTVEGTRLRASLIERASGVLATHLPAQLAPGERRRLVFLLPNPTQSLGRFLAVSLLLADFVHRQGVGVPSREKGPLLRGDLLLVTQHIRECVALLRGVSVQHGSEALPLSSFWPIEVLSQYTPSPDDRPRVFVANPGWYSTLGERAVFASVVIDVSHPRTADHLHGLLAQSTIAAAPVQILVIPPWEEDRLRTLQESHRLTTLAWVWDPAAVAAIERVLSVSTAVTELLEPERHIWVCPDEPVHTLLAPLHEALLGAMRVGGRQLPSAIFEAWAVYHRLRELAVPLVQVEEAWRRDYRSLTLKERLHMLEEHIPKSSGPLGMYLESRWPEIVDNLRATYGTLLQRKEPAKFYTLASVVEQHLQSKEDGGQLSSLRIVAPTLHEADLLSSLLGQVIDGWSDALLEGAVTLTTVREEPRLIAEGHCQASVLLGFRTSDTRYLDVYPGVPVHVVAYPYEAEVDEAIQRRVHASIEQLQQDTTRTTLLSALHFPVTQATSVSGPGESGQLEELVPRTRRPPIRYHVEPGKPLSITRRFQADTVEPLDMGKLAGMTWTDELVIGNLSETMAAEVDRAERLIEFVEVVDADGDHVRYPASRLIDVYYPATERWESVPAGQLHPGMLLVVLVDDRYEDLYHRLLEAIEEQRDLRSSLTLEFWRRTKQAMLARHRGSRRQLHEYLADQGLSVEYAAVTAWYRYGRNETLAPETLEDFEIVAMASGMYSERAQIALTFTCIQRERVNRRLWARKLRRLLARIADGLHYEEALQSARALDTPVEQVAAAVSIREVRSVQLLGGLSSLDREFA